jgi:DNA-binding NtrC family response regulator
MAALQAYEWPGNVRELQNVIERAMILSQGTVLRVEEVLGSAAPERRVSIRSTGKYHGKPYRAMPVRRPRPLAQKAPATTGDGSATACDG